MYSIDFQGSKRKKEKRNGLEVLEV